MLRINEYNIEPGVYNNHANGEIYVVVDLITHTWNDTAKLHEALPVPTVVYRALNQLNHHQRFTIPLDLFQQHFTKAK